jgi:translation initiation factor 5A
MVTNPYSVHTTQYFFFNAPTCLQPRFVTQVPNVTLSEWSLLDIDDGFYSIMGQNGDMREDLAAPDSYNPHLAEKIAATLAADQAAGRDTMITVLAAIEKENVVDVKLVQDC